MSFFQPYRAVLQVPHARSAFAASLVGRLSFGIVGVSLILTLTPGGKNYEYAGLVMALFGLFIVLASPLRAWLIDRHGPRRTLAPMAAAFAVVLVAIAVIPLRPGLNETVIAVLAATAGAAIPPLGVVMRTVWSELVSDRGSLQTAYSLDGTVEELLNVTGPVIAGVVTVIARPAVGLTVSAGLVFVGTLLFLAQPALRTAGRPETGPTSPDKDTSPEGPGAGRSVLALAFATGAIGLCLGGVGLVIVAFCQARHDPAAVAWIEAALSVGSAIGGLAYGAVRWRISAQHRLALLTIGLLLILMSIGLSPNVPIMALFNGIAGLLVSPALSTAYLLASNLASPKARNQAGNWVNSGYTAGNSAGTVLSGQLVGRLPLSACLPILAVPTILAIVPLLKARVDVTGQQVPTSARLADKEAAAEK